MPRSVSRTSSGSARRARSTSSRRPPSERRRTSGDQPLVPPTTGLRRQHEAPRPGVDLRLPGSDRATSGHGSSVWSTGPTAVRGARRRLRSRRLSALLRELHPSVRAIGVDLSPGMAGEAAPARVRGERGCRSLAAARMTPSIGFWRRTCCTTVPTSRPPSPSCAACLRPGGSLVAVTNAHDHLFELWDVYARGDR